MKFEGEFNNEVLPSKLVGLMLKVDHNTGPLVLTKGNCRNMATL